MGAVETRHAKRDSLFMLGDIVLEATSERERVKIRNLSPGGMMAESERPLALGTRVSVDLPNVGLAPGAVSWSRGRRIGITFDEAIDPTKVRFQLGNGGHTPSYARAAPTAARHDGWNGKLRRI